MTSSTQPIETASTSKPSDCAPSSTASESDARLKGWEVNMLWRRDGHIEHDLRLEWSKREKAFIESLASCSASTDEKSR
ncbi:hypothetical protein QR680_004800 [Steinernema hermaphroditum]|uniref:Uncharacterized protein n=1 Tax=Steinernema hermaphroditum TaxID=289476 RepID=A0AA39HR23_9BILA|nr:hypothetical protein QR680_004800 [Steinernema hermaphroditum]